MSQEVEQLKEQLQHFSERFGPGAIIPATVLKVNENSTVSIELVEGGQIDDCRLKAIVKDGSEFILIPNIGSTVLVGKIDNSDECAVLCVSEIAEIRYVVGNVVFLQKADGFVVKKDADTLRQVFELIIEAVQEIVVIQGTNPNRLKLQQALQKAQNILKNGA